MILRLVSLSRLKSLAMMVTAASFILYVSPLWGQWTGGPTGPIYYNGGNVGIGTASPGATLHVNGSILMPNAGSGGGFYSLDSNAAGQRLLYLANDAALANATRLRSGGSGITLQSSANANLMTILDGGYVGIGTTNPAQLLEVSGASEPLIRVTNTGMSGSPYLVMGMNAGNNAALFQATNGKDFKFYNGQYALTILGSNGNVGIGTTAPPYPLSVKGTIGAGEVIVTSTSGWSDYVFAPEYKLRPLKEVAAYIKENHHLPEIPSAKEVKEKGVSLGEMQSKLLAKIEELTLHMIQAQRENQELREQIQEIKRRIGR